MPFNRFEEQCSKCDCYIENIAKIDVGIASDMEIECSQDLDIYAEKPCKFFINFITSTRKLEEIPSESLSYKHRS